MPVVLGKGRKIDGSADLVPPMMVLRAGFVVAGGFASNVEGAARGASGRTIILVPLMMVRAGFVVAGGFASAGVSSCTSVGVLMTNDLDPGMIVGAGCSPADSSPTPLVGRLSESAGDALVPMSELKAPTR